MRVMAKIEQIASWLSIFKQRAAVHVADSPMAMAYLESFGYRVGGAGHAYNRIGLHKLLMRMSDDMTKIWLSQEGGSVFVEGPAKIREVMNFLNGHNLRLLNSGNHREQQMIGAIVGNTHGFGPSASMRGHVLRYWYASHGVSEDFKPGAAIYRVEVKVEPVTSFEVTNCVCRLSHIESQFEGRRGYAILPYSDPKDPVVIVAEYVAVPPQEVRSSEPGVRGLLDLPKSWWRLRVWWAVDRFFPAIRKLIQRGLNYLQIDPWMVVTDANDVDAMYHQWPTTDGVDDMRFQLWAMKPTYTCYNISFSCHHEFTKEIYNYLVLQGERIKPGLFRTFIGVREDTDRNRDNLDIYCSKNDWAHLTVLQQMITEAFGNKIEWHTSKHFKFGRSF